MWARFRGVIVVFFWVALCSGQAAAAAETQRLVLLHSYHRNMAWSEGVTQAVLEQFSAQESVDVIVEYMDTKRIYNPAYLANYADYLKKKYKDRPIDAILASDNNALDFLVQRGESVFGPTPVIFCGVNFFRFSMLEGKKNFSGVPEEFDALGTVKAALRLQPATEEVFVIHDHTPTGLAWANTVREQLTDLRGLRIRFAQPGSFDDLVEQVQALPPEAIGLFTVYFRDQRGRFLGDTEAVRRLSRASPVPLYGLLDFYLGHGLLGGKLISGYHQGQAAASLAQRVLKGTPPSELPLVRSGVNQMMFDQKQLERFDLAQVNLPPQSTIINQDPSFYQENRRLVWVVGIFLMVQSLVLVYLAWALLSRRRAQQTAAQQSAQYRALVETLPQGLLEVDAQGQIGFANQAAADLFDRHLESLKEQNIDNLLSTGHSQHLSDLIEEIFAKRSDPGVTDAHFIDRRGRERWFEVLWNFTSPGADRLLLLLTEVTERREIQSKLEEYTLQLEQLVDEKTSEYKTLLNQQQTLLDNSLVGIVVTQERRFMMANKQLAKMTGWELDQIIGQYAVDFYATAEDRDRVSNEGYARLASGQPYHTEIQIRHRDGHTFWCSLAGRAIDPDDLSEGIIWVLVDITETRKAWDDLAQAKSRAEEAARAKSDFLARMSHEIRTPMNGIVGMLEFLGGTETTRDQTEALDLMDHSARTLMGVINDILDFSKLESGKIQLAPSDYPLKEELDKLGKLYRREAEARILDLHLEFDDRLPRQVHLDGLRLTQVLSNLLNNAIKFTEPGGAIHLRALAPQPGQLHFEVEDSGIGVPEEKRESIFLAFEQVSEQTNLRFGGSGLGLAICKRLTDLMKGRISVTDGAQGGAKFIVDLSYPTERPIQPPEHLLQTTEGDLVGIRLLLVEDNLANQKVALKILGRMNAQVKVAENGQEALEILAQEDFDLVLMDMRMPVVDGLEATRRIRRGEGGVRRLDVPIIALTANAMEQDRKSCLDAGMNDFVAKPFKATELQRRIRALL